MSYIILIDRGMKYDMYYLSNIKLRIFYGVYDLLYVWWCMINYMWWISILILWLIYIIFSMKLHFDDLLLKSANKQVALDSFFSHSVLLKADFKIKKSSWAFIN